MAADARRRYQRTLPGIVPSQCSRHEDWLLRLDEQIGEIRETAARTEGKVDVLVQRSATPLTSAPARRGVSAKTVGTIVGALGAVIMAYGAAKGWL